MTGLTVDGTAPEDVKVDGTSIKELKVDGVRVWPILLTDMTAGTDGTNHGYNVNAGPIGSLSGDQSIEGGTIEIMEWLDLSPEKIILEIDGTHNQDLFDEIIMETDQGIVKRLTANADNFQQSGGKTQWNWNYASQAFSDGNTYEIRIVR